VPSPHDAAPHADRLAGLGVLAGGVVHELGGSLAVLVTNLTVATEQLLAAQAAPQGEREPPPELGASLGEALEAAQRLRSLVGDLKTFARVELPGGASGNQADLRAALGAVLRLLEYDLKQRARLTLDFGPVARVAIHEARLAALLLQVFVLVLQRLPRDTPAPLAVQVTTRSQGPELVIGFPPALAAPGLDARALQANFYFVHSLAEQLGAHLEETRAPSDGAVLRLRLPAASQSTRPPSDPTLLSVLPLPRVLVIDDEPLLCEAVRRMLAGEAEIETTNSPVEGLARLLSQERFDAVLCDLLMPVKNGMELFQELEAKRPEVAARLGFVTGGAFSEEAQAFLRANEGRVLEKPFSRSGLRGLLRTLLSGKFVKR
jgi:CheY-like chemotaxis protein